MKARFIPCALTLALTACAGSPERNVPRDVTGMMPERFTEVLPLHDTQVPLEWWKAFNDPQLDELVARGLQRNGDLAIAAQRLRQAHAAFRSSRAEQLPGVDAFIDTERDRAPSRVNPGTAIVESSAAGISVGYEVDLWGRLAAQTEAQRQRYLAQGYTLASLRLTIAAEIVRGYLQAQALGAARAVIDENVQVLGDQLRLSEHRSQIGAISQLDLQRFRSELEDSKAQLAEVGQRQQATRRALLLLAGELPTEQALSSLAVRAESRTPDQLPEVPTGLPSALLDRRPDVRAAEANLAGAGADLSAARRAWFPSIVLTGSAGEVSGTLSTLMKDGVDVWSMGASLVQAVFDGGRRNAIIEASSARHEELAETYRDTVRRAFNEVVDALEARAAAAEIHRARAAQAEALATALRLAQRRYDQGYSDYLGVLDARRSLLQSRLAVADARRSAAAAYVDLALAVGGGWQPENPW
jgi:outer membrane protein, multidrug efflux system